VEQQPQSGFGGAGALPNTLLHMFNKAWRLLWKVEVPPKIRVFWWRILHGFLPTKHTLHTRHKERVPICDTCGASRLTRRLAVDENVSYHWKYKRR
jgi:hypothetical protein